MFKLRGLVSGGLIVNYECSSKCKHCAYSSSPSWPREYIKSSMSDSIFSNLRKMGCSSIHIGGGEPLLIPERIFPILESAKNHGISIDYIETNASWFREGDWTLDILRKLKSLGVSTLLISLDPYHNEYVPFYKVKGLMKACGKVNMGVFPWLMEFWDELDYFDDSKPHSLEEYERAFGEDYLKSLPQRYGLSLKGRALKTYKPLMKDVSLESIIEASHPCGLLSGRSHFHVDLYGNYIPQSCPGFSIPLRELREGVARTNYPIIDSLEREGIKGLLSYAKEKYGFEAKESYKNECDLCYDIRNYLSVDLDLNLKDLEPKGHYLYI